MRMRLVTLVLSLMASFSVTAQADDNAHQFTVDLPAQWQEAARIRLVLEGVTVPGNRPFKFRVTTVTAERQILVLGSAGIVAERPTRSEPRRLPSFRIDVTHPLKAHSKQLAHAPTLTIAIQAVNGRNIPLPDMRWSTERARLETTR